MTVQKNVKSVYQLIKKRTSSKQYNGYLFLFTFREIPAHCDKNQKDLFKCSSLSTVLV